MTLAEVPWWLGVLVLGGTQLLSAWGAVGVQRRQRMAEQRHAVDMGLVEKRDEVLLGLNRLRVIDKEIGYILTMIDLDDDLEAAKAVENPLAAAAEIVVELRGMMAVAGLTDMLADLDEFDEWLQNDGYEAVGRVAHAIGQGRGTGDASELTEGVVQSIERGGRLIDAMVLKVQTGIAALRAAG